MIQLKETGAQLAQSERLAAVGELAAGIAHEVNNPINYATNALRTLRVHLRSVERLMNAVAPIHGSTGSELEEQLVGVRKLMDEIEHDELPPQIEELIAIAMDGLDRTERLVHELHHFSVPSKDSHSEVDLRATVKSTLALMQHALRTANIHVRVELPDALPILTGDPTLINQVLLNILKNASEAMESRGGGTIDIAVRLDGSCVLVEVRDDGPGMSAEVRQRLFEPFFSTKPAGHGAGLGLSICRRILEECGGSIEVNSSPGAGAAFRVRLPIDALPPESVPSPPCL
jgi:signal transduction histidine kinase